MQSSILNRKWRSQLALSDRGRLRAARPRPLRLGLSGGAAAVVLWGCTAVTPPADRGPAVAATPGDVSGQGPGTSAGPRTSEIKTLGTGDVIEVRVFREEDLSGTYQIAATGMILMPLVGEVRVGELTPSQAAEVIAARYAEGYLTSPQVVVFVKEYNSKRIYVMGEVKSPGSFSYTDHLTILQAITLAGGFTNLAAREQVLVTRTTDAGEQKLRVSITDISRGEAENIALNPGDLIFVPEAIF